MSDSIRALQVRATADTSDLQRGMNDASQSIQGVSTSAGSAQQGVNRSSNSMASALGKVKVAAAAAAAAAVAAGVAYAANLVRTGLQAADEQAKLARQLGMTATELATLERAADLSGISASNLTRSVEGLNRRLGEALEGAGPTADALERLGLSAEELVELSPQEQFEALGEAIEQLGSHAERSAAAQDLFGRSGQRMLLLLDGAEDTFARASGEVEAFGLALDEETGRAIERINDDLSTMGASIEGAALQMAATFAPAIQNVADVVVRLSGIVGNASRGLRTFAEEVRGGNEELTERFRLQNQVNEATEDEAPLTVAQQRRYNALQESIDGVNQRLTEERDALADAETGLEDLQLQAQNANMTVDEFAERFEHAGEELERYGSEMIAAQISIRGLTARLHELGEEQENVRDHTERTITAMTDTEEAERSWADVLEGARAAREAAFAGIDQQAALAESLGQPFDETAEKAAFLEDQIRELIDISTVEFDFPLDRILETDNAIMALVETYRSFNEEVEATDVQVKGMQDAFEKLTATERESLEGRIETLQESFATESDAIQRHYDEQLDMLRQANQNKLIADEEYIQLRAQIEETAQKRLEQIEREAMNKRISFAANAYGMMASNIIGAVEGIATATADSEEKQFKIRKNAAIASALVSTAQGVARTIADYPFPLSAAMAASQIALGAGQIAAIKSQTFNGGGSPTEPTAPAPDTTTAEASAPDMQRSITIQGVDPGMLYSGEAVRALMDNIAEQQRDGYQVLLT